MLENNMWLGTELYSGSFGKEYSFKEFNEQISYALDLGVNKIDTAECYGYKNSIEELLGESLNKRRSKVTLSTKFGHVYKSQIKEEAFGIESVEKQFEESLKRLKTDYIDIYYFHSGNNVDFFNDKLWEMLNKKKRDGAIGSLGLSLKHSLVIEKNYEQLLRAKEYGINTIQTVLNIFSKQSLDFVIPFCKNNNLNIISRMPLAKGLLSGKYNIGHKFNLNDERSKDKIITNKIISNNLTSADEAIRWVKNYVSEIIIGSKDFQQIKSNFYSINNL